MKRIFGDSIDLHKAASINTFILDVFSVDAALSALGKVFSYLATGPRSSSSLLYR